MSAARLMSSGTQNIAAFVYFDYYGRTHLFCVDQTLDTNFRSTSGKGAATVGDICKIIYEDHITSAPKTLRGIDVAMLTAACRAKRAVIVHASDMEIGTKEVTVVEKGDLNEYQFFVKLVATALKCVPTHSHILPTELLEPLLQGKERVLLIAGDMPEYTQLVRSLPRTVLANVQDTLTTVNVGASVTKRLQREVPNVEGKIDAVQGPGALEMLTKLK